MTWRSRLRAMFPRGVRAVTLPARAIDMRLRERMFALFSTYYEGVRWDAFCADLDEKDDVILLLDGRTGEVCGFSTLQSRRVGPVLGVYSGDTVLAREHWGNSALGRAFLGYLFRLKLRNPGTPVYWFLISKGYKTYLLMARNFARHFPRLEGDTPAFEKGLMDAFYGAKFGARYDSQKSLVRFHDQEGACRLSETIAPISDAMRENNPHIGFFVARNPHWQRGDELACLAEMTFSMPVRYAAKKILRRVLSRRGSVRAGEVALAK